MQHQQDLERIDDIEVFFESIGLKKTRDFPVNWNLDSSIKFEPITKPYIIEFRNEERTLISVNVYIMGGLSFNLRGNIGVSVYETIKTDYYFKCKYEESEFFLKESRNYKIKQLL